MTEKDNLKSSRSFLKYTGLAFQMMATIVVLAFGGRFADRQIHFGFPVFTLLGTVMGVLGSLYIILKRL